VFSHSHTSIKKGEQKATIMGQSRNCGTQISLKNPMTEIRFWHVLDIMPSALGINLCNRLSLTMFIQSYMLMKSKS
jgi:hypothetical protein